MPHLTTSALTQSFTTTGGQLTAISNIDLEVERGEFVSILGPSGAGKTTLLKIIGGLMTPTSGQVLINDLPPSEAQRKKMLGFVFQDPSLLPWRTVSQNIHLPLELNRQNQTSDVDIEHLLEAVGLAEFRDYYPHQLSGGMKQRVALARALATEPEILLMDEPFGSLDEMTRASMRYELLRIWDGLKRTVIFVTHSIQEAVLMSDRVIVMSARPGRVIGETPIELARPRDEETEEMREYFDYIRKIKQMLSNGTNVARHNVKASS